MEIWNNGWNNQLLAHYEKGGGGALTHMQIYTSLTASVIMYIQDLINKQNL